MNILDTTALFKLVVYPDIIEQGSDYLQDFKKKFGRLYTYESCIGECLNVFKRKSGKDKIISKDGHKIIGNRLMSFTKKFHSIKVKHYRFQTPAYQETALELMMTHGKKIDFIDAYHIAVTYHRFPYAKFIAADKKCLAAAKTLGLDTWNCEKPYQIKA